MDLKDLYQEIILDHGKNPRNFGKCKDFTNDAKGHNPLCGDKVHIFAQLDNNKKILDLSFEGEGCAISLASASILTDILKGKDFSLASGIIENFLDLIKKNKLLTLNSLDESQKTTLMSLSGVKDYPMRVKCATMAWHTVSSVLGKKMKIKEKIISEIKKVYDPEIPVNIYDLGLIYSINIKNDNEAYIEMTLTSPNCPVADSLPKMVKENISSIEGIKKVDLKLVWSPPWTKDMMSEEAKLELNL